MSSATLRLNLHIICFGDEHDDDRSWSGSSGTCPFSFSEYSVGRVRGSNSVVCVNGTNFVVRVSVSNSVDRVSGIFYVVHVSRIFSRSKNFLVSNSEFLIFSLDTFASLTLPTVTSSQPYLDASQSELSVNPSTLVAGPVTDLSLSAVLVGDSPKSRKFGLSAKT